MKTASANRSIGKQHGRNTEAGQGQNRKEGRKEGRGVREVFSCKKEIGKWGKDWGGG